ncbi:MAG: hypothetical protein PHQ89_02055 [Bacilli bacterium]|nr:hypothetical protein [Bacilli bacterium]
MYNENERENRPVWRGFLIKALIVILFVFLLMWIIPFPNLNPVYDNLFNQNVESMRDAAKGYYTVERLPKNVGDTTKMTLAEMLDKKLVLSFTDSKGKQCDTKASYVEVIKAENEYVIKVYLSCSTRTDYILYHYGCYDICSDTCKATVTPTVTPTKNTVVKYQYVYRKDFSETRYRWTDWSSDIAYTSSDNISFGCTADKCTEVSPNSPKYEYVGTKTIYKTDANGNKISIYKESLTNLIGSYQISACAAYNYVMYETYGTYSYTTGASWVYQGIVSFRNAPSDTPTERYEYVGAGFADNCTGTCSSDYLLFRKYTIKATQVTTSTNASSIVITCDQVATKTVDLYGKKKEFVGFEVDKKVDIYKTVTYYRYKTRESYTHSYYDIQRRSYLDQSLINKGYRLISKTLVK